MTQNSRVIKFPRRGRFVEAPRLPMTPERQARGRAWIAHLRQILREVDHG